MSALQRVMCVEDDADIRMVVEFSLGTVGGYEVRCFPGGQAALAAVDEFRPDVVLLDVMMPGLTGPETLQLLRQRPVMQGVPVVFMTAKAMPDEVESLLRHGATGMIVKPFDAMKLPADVRLFWEHGRAPGAA